MQEQIQLYLIAKRFKLKKKQIITLEINRFTSTKESNRYQMPLNFHMADLDLCWANSNENLCIGHLLLQIHESEKMVLLWQHDRGEYRKICIHFLNYRLKSGKICAFRSNTIPGRGYSRLTIMRSTILRVLFHSYSVINKDIFRSLVHRYFYFIW